MTYHFDADIAAIYGVDEAIMIQNLSFWIRKNEANGKHFHEGRYWTYNSIEAFTKLFPFWSSRQVRRVLKSLEDKGVIVTGNYNTSAYDRTTWYAFGDSFLQNGLFHFTISENGCAGTGNCNIDNASKRELPADKNPDENTDDSADGGLFQPDPDFKQMTVTRPRRTSEPLCLFADSIFNDFEKFAAEFKYPEFMDVDLVYYFHAVADWSSRFGKKQRDWIATARNFMRNDKRDGKLARVKTQADDALSPDAIKYLADMAD